MALDLDDCPSCRLPDHDPHPDYEPRREREYDRDVERIERQILADNPWLRGLFTPRVRP